MRTQFVPFSQCLLGPTPAAERRSAGNGAVPNISDGRTAGAYDGLNALRGIAALGVVLFHAHAILGMAVPNGALAVDFFFLLSGFVVAHAYDRRLGAGMSAKSFMLVRLARFYPMYLLGLAVGSLVIVGLFVAGAPAFPISQPLAALLLAFFFLPRTPSTYSSELLYPLNPPAWSLAVELGVNALYALCFRWLTVRRLAAVSVVSLAVMLMTRQPIGGGDWPSAALGYARALFSFPLGALIYRTKPTPIRGLPFAGLLLVIALALPLTGKLYELVFVTVISPVILLLATGRVPDSLRPVCRYLGRTSYPIYAIHFPSIMLTDSAAILLHIDRRMMFVGLLIALLCSCWWLDRFDERLRRKQGKHSDAEKWPSQPESRVHHVGSD